MASRPCRYSLAVQDDSVFADFDIDSDGRVTLVGISFDGYGYFGTAGKVSSMPYEVSGRWIDLVEKSNVGSDELSVILSEYFRENSSAISNEALLEHGLI